MSRTFTLSSRESVLRASIYPPITLDDGDSYVLGLINFISSNSIPNVDENNNKFYYGDEGVVKIPEGSYELSDIIAHITQSIDNNEKEMAEEDRTALMINANKNTLKCEIKCNKDIDFSEPDTIGSLLGFKQEILEKNIRHTSDFGLDILKVNCISVECNLITNSYNNGKPVHILHMFYPVVPPGYKIVENPLNVIYLPINTRYIDEIILKIVDQDGNLINFKRELITVRLHLKKVT